MLDIQYLALYIYLYRKLLCTRHRQGQTSGPQSSQHIPSRQFDGVQGTCDRHTVNRSTENPRPALQMVWGLPLGFKLSCRLGQQLLQFMEVLCMVLRGNFGECLPSVKRGAAVPSQALWCGYMADKAAKAIHCKWGE